MFHLSFWGSTKKKDMSHGTDAKENRITVKLTSFGRRNFRVIKSGPISRDKSCQFDSEEISRHFGPKTQFPDDPAFQMPKEEINWR
jgi:hypothetical protein